MGTQSTTQTITITSSDVRDVMVQMSNEIHEICEIFADLTKDFNIEEAAMDTSILALNDVISAVKLQFYLKDELLAEHSYSIADRLLEPSNDSLSIPPPGIYPPETRIRLVAIRNSNRPPDHIEFWLKKLGWRDAKPLTIPANARYQAQGVIVSGGYGVQRHLLLNPKYDMLLQSAAQPHA